MILAIKTDAPEAELYLLTDTSIAAQKKWLAHRQLSETIHSTIDELFQVAKAQLADLTGIIFYEGPGSFTGLRIGCSVANALATSYNVPIIGTTSDDWLELGSDQLLKGMGKKTIEPNYGSEPHITRPN